MPLIWVVLACKDCDAAGGVGTVAIVENVVVESAASVGEYIAGDDEENVEVIENEGVVAAYAAVESVGYGAERVGVAVVPALIALADAAAVLE